MNLLETYVSLTIVDILFNLFIFIFFVFKFLIYFDLNALTLVNQNKTLKGRCLWYVANKPPINGNGKRPKTKNFNKDAPSLVVVCQNGMFHLHFTK